VGHCVDVLSGSENAFRSSRRRAVHLAAFGLAFALLVTVAPAGAQQAVRSYRIGLLADTPPRTPELARLTDALLQGLRDHGYVEGRNLVIERRYSEGEEARNAEFVAEFVRMKVDLILAGNSSAAHAAMQATSTIPIVMLNVGNPERQGLVASLAQPGGNITGMSNQLGGEASGKMFQLLRDALPTFSRVGILWNPDNQSSGISFRDETAMARRLRVEIVSLEVRRADELDSAFEALMRSRPDVLWAHLTMTPYRTRILEFAMKQRLPVVSQTRFWADAGALMTYGPDSADLFRRGGRYAARILSGAKPGDLPVEQPTRFEFVINMKTARALGLAIPASVRALADDVIE
jgi:putative ABC transport system substrate-binding protein